MSGGPPDATLPGMDSEDEVVWDNISSEFLLGLLRRAAAGEDPDLIVLELLANAGQGDSDSRGLDEQ